MSKVNLNTFDAFTESVVNTSNANVVLIQNAMDNTLSRDGTAPNQMNADLDMNSNGILNCADPINNLDVVNKEYGDANYGGAAAAAAEAAAAAAEAAKETGFALAIAIPGTTLLSNEWLFGFNFDVAVTFAIDLFGSYAKCGNTATVSSTLSIKKNGVQFATLTYGAGSSTGSFTCASGASFAKGDLLEVYAAGSPDATLSHLSITLFATRV